LRPRWPKWVSRSGWWRACRKRSWVVWGVGAVVTGRRHYQPPRCPPRLRAISRGSGNKEFMAATSPGAMPTLAFGTPRKLPSAASLQGRVVVLDIAFAGTGGGGFDKVTRKLIDGLGDRLRGWIDHHDHERHGDYADDPRFVLRTKAQHGACPEMITPELVQRIGPVDTVLCHTDFDGL